MPATLLMRSDALRLDTPLTNRDVKRKLESLKVVHGVNWTTIERILANKLFDRTHDIAWATPAKEGTNAFIEEKIMLTSLRKSRQLGNGKADFRNLENIRHVKKGDVLLIKHPAIPGDMGMDIFGGPILPDVTQDIQVRAGINTTLDADGSRLLATADGYLYYSDGAACVGETFVVKGNVNFRTGNIQYHGNVCIEGDVADGFRVEADGDILVEGSVEAAEIISNGGSVHIRQGIFGHGKGRIRAKVSIHIQSARDTHLECDGALEVEKELRHCVVIAGAVKSDAHGCCIIGGSIKSYADVSVFNIGSQGTRTEVHIVDKQADEAKLRLTEIGWWKQRVLAKMPVLERRVVVLTAIAKRFGSKMSTRMRNEMNEAISQYDQSKIILKSLEEERGILLNTANSVHRRTGTFKIKEKVNYGVYLNFYGHVRHMRPEDAGKEWCWTPEDITQCFTNRKNHLDAQATIQDNIKHPQP